MGAELRLRRDPVPALMGVGDPLLEWAVRGDVMGERLDPRALWTLPFVLRAAGTQAASGAWPYPARGAGRSRPKQDYDQLQTYKTLLVLVSQYRLDRRHPSLERAAEFMLSRQTAVGDLRGIYGSQYTPNYTADTLQLLIAAGYEGDPRIARGMDWLLAIRQSDGGWALPSRTAGRRTLGAAVSLGSPIEPDRSKPSSHLITGIVLRAFAAHPRHRHSAPALRAAKLLAGRFFKRDVYVDHGAAGYWTKLRFPFRWTDLVSSLDAVATVGLGPANPEVREGLRWLISHQRPDGLWNSGYPNDPDPLHDHWVSFAVVRVFKRFFDGR